jgi:hypothetical protein
VAVAGRREMRQVASSQRVAFVLELLENLLVADRDPGYVGVGDEVQAQRLVGLLFELALADVALVGEGDEAPLELPRYGGSS